MALRPGTTVVLGAALAIGSMVGAYAVWAAGVHGGIAAAAYSVLALIGLVGAGMTLRDLTPPALTPPRSAQDRWVPWPDVPTDHRRRVVRVAACTLAAAAAATLTACGGSSSASPTTAAPSSDPVPVAPILATVGDLSIAAGYVPAPASPDVAAAYLTVIDGGAADTLVKASSDVSKTVTLHRTQGGEMVAIPSLPVPAGGLASFSPGANHLMLENLTRTLVKGDRVELTLVFQKAGTVTVTVPVTGYPVGGALPSEALSPLPSTTAAS